MPSVRPVVALFLLASFACDNSSGPEDPVPAVLEVSAPADTLRHIGATVTLTAVVRDKTGAEISGAKVQWLALDASMVGLDGPARVIAISAGAGRVVAAAGAAADTVILVVAPAPARVVISPSADTLTFIGDSVRLAAAVFDAGGTPVRSASSTWTSSGPGVVEVFAGGLARALAPGLAQVTARSGEAVGTAEILVRQAPASLRMPAGPIQLAVGASTDVIASVLDAAGIPIAGSSVSWSARNGAIATATAEGRVRGVSPGSTWLVASSGSLRDSVAVAVVQVVASVRITPTTDTLRYIGATRDLTAVARDPSGAGVAEAKIDWRSLQPGIAVVSSEGRVTAREVGSARIVASAASAADTASVTVVQAPARVSVIPPLDTLTFIGDTVRLAATVADQGGTQVAGAAVAWGSSSEDVASVGATGLVKAHTNGSARITAKSGDVTGAADIVVRQVPSSLRMPAGPITVALGVEADVVARVSDAGGATVAGSSASWTSRNAAIATVTSGGRVRGVSVGDTWLVAAAGPLTDSVAVTVVQRLAALAVRPASVELAAFGDTAEFAVVGIDDAGQPFGGSLSAVWTVADSRIATYLGDGRFAALANGVTRVSAEAGGLTGSADLAVRQKVAAVGVALGRDTLRALGDTTRASALPRDARGHDVGGRAVAWTSSAPAVAAVHPTSGVVTAVGAGRSWIRASVDGARDSLWIAVSQAAVSVGIAGGDRMLEPGDRVALSAVVRDARGAPIAGLNPTWTSSLPSVATVDATGVVMGVALGEAWIVAAHLTLRDSVRVRVDSPPGPRLRVLAAPPGGDTVDHISPEPLTLKLIPRSGASAAGEIIRLAALWRRSGWITPTVVLDSLAGSRWREDLVLRADSAGVVRAKVRMGKLSGSAGVVVTVPTVGLTDTIFLEVAPGAATAVLLSPADTAVQVGRAFRPFAYTTDRYSNSRPDPVTFLADPGAQVSGDSIRGLEPARLRFMASSGPLRDTSWLSVVPAGTLAAFRVREHTQDTAGIGVLELDGRSYRYLTAELGSYFGRSDLTWVPGRERIAYHGGTYDKRLFIVTLAGVYWELPTRLIESGNLLHPDASPDGKWIYFAGQSSYWGQAIFRTPAEGGASERVGPFAGKYDMDASPAVSPDGARVAYHTNRVDPNNGGQHIRVFDVATGTVSAFDIPGSVPRWSPDGSEIAFIRGGGIHVMTASGVYRRQVTTGAGYDRVDWSPDGAWFLASQGLGGIELVRASDGLRLPLAFASKLTSARFRR